MTALNGMVFSEQDSDGQRHCQAMPNNNPTLHKSTLNSGCLQVVPGFRRIICWKHAVQVTRVLIFPETSRDKFLSLKLDKNGRLKIFTLRTKKQLIAKFSSKKKQNEQTYY